MKHRHKDKTKHPKHQLTNEENMALNNVEENSVFLTGPLKLTNITMKILEVFKTGICPEKNWMK